MIQIFITGGTFDKEYNYISGELSFSKTHLPEMLKRGRCSLDTVVETIMMKDSLDMTIGDRRLIAEKMIDSPHDQIVLTHGTDTMVDTAAYLAKENALQNKTIVITGAMIPYTFGVSSDGFFNLGSALSFVQVLPPGLYISMNGRYFNWDNVQKNYNTGIFEIPTPQF
ncbi:asparaginase domain-containing protein [Membranihabitans marinus]|uniref:asparaginase domain-containing protein n=1 Tax=Membranihabitans marinus TaxID=1227546 RepID=UPI001F2C914D|nr:asparaginase domain-containing protein [Membranihabitans marinus]